MKQQTSIVHVRACLAGHKNNSIRVRVVGRTRLSCCFLQFEHMLNGMSFAILSDAAWLYDASSSEDCHYKLSICICKLTVVVCRSC